MYQAINQNLSNCQQDLCRLQKIDAMLTPLRSELKALEQKASRAQSLLEKENRDYEKITRTTLATLFYSLLGSRGERIEKERLEAFEAQLKYTQCLADMEDIKKQISFLESERHQYQFSKAQYDKYYKEKQRLLLEDHGETAQKIMELHSQIDKSKAYQQEISEALTVGSKIGLLLSQGLQHLSQAQGWGLWDMMGGDTISTFAKHSNIDKVNAIAFDIQSHLLRLRTELADVNIHADVQVNISDFAKFADFFFDGLIADWFVQDKMNATKQSFEQAKDDVEQVMAELRHLKEKEFAAQKQLNAQIDQLVLKA